MSNTNKSLENRLNDYPELKKRVENLLDVVENANEDAELADEAERQVIETLRDMGHDALTGWASRSEQHHGDQSEKKFGTPHEKKSSSGTPPTEI